MYKKNNALYTVKTVGLFLYSVALAMYYFHFFSSFCEHVCTSLTVAKYISLTNQP